MPGTAATIAATSPCSAAVSDSMVVSNDRFSRSDMIATPWSPIVPLTRIASPGRARSPPMSTPSGTTPTPVVVMKTPSPLPCSTTLVSPVTIGTPASRDAAAIDSDDALQVRQRKSLLEHERRGEIERARARHRDVVDRAVDGEAADVAARERTAATRRARRWRSRGVPAAWRSARCRSARAATRCRRRARRARRRAAPSPLPPLPCVMSTRPCLKSTGRT